MIATNIYPTLEVLLTHVRACRACEPYLPLGCRPVVQAASPARILIVGQAPGARVHASGIPWDDASGERLRAWMGIDRDVFYDASRIAIIPMGYCYPGRGASGDLPPRRECAQLWLDLLLARLPRIELTLLVGLHAQRHFLRSGGQLTLAGTLKRWRDFAPQYLPLPHPSPRNTPWFQRNAWFERELLPALRARVASLSSQAKQTGAAVATEGRLTGR
jgi:uracil-DNA glycosylase